MIFNYLNPVTLVALKELGLRRVTDVSLSFRCADFSQCNTVRTETLLAFFTSDRIDIIQEINFDGLFFVKSEDLEKCIVQCKNLTVLSVIECGVTFKNVFRILASCPLLKELYWSVNSKGYSHKCNTQFFCLEKIYFYAQLDVNFDNEVIKTILQICPNANDVCLNLSSYYTKTFPPYIARNAFTGRILHEGRKEPLCVCLAAPEPISKNSAKLVMVQLCLKTKPRTLTFMEFRDGEDKLYFLTNFSSFLQIYTEEKHLNNILMLPDESVHSLNLFLTEDPEFFTLNHIEKIKKVTGNRLRQMTLHNISKSTSPLEFRKNTGIIKQITSYSQNIAVLNLSESHFDDNFPFPTLYCLKGLKVLSLPSCIFKVDADFKMTNNQLKDFERMIDKCPNVENFGFHGCLLCIFGPDDDGLAPIYKWKKLKHLTLSKVVSFRVCPFLKNVAYHCPDLTTLELMELGEPLVCHYMPMVMYIIRQSKKLKFLRLNQTCMNPNISVFWKAIESAVNLQGLCISTMSNAHIINKIVTDALKKLPFLHVFHLTARHMCQNLKSQVKQIMNKKKFQVSNVVILESIQSYAGVRHCGLVHFTLDDVIAY
ncbi:f-box domain-containing protein [Trichonephila clavata]|uniref:F-box domain-containing protein n=1 Tax=Trichonephila clavata TaxID=2740835 RepID=A0A8X6HBJ8_TRICU|nr:f-box domain-containing protein [Trichonephila clavata]